MQETYWSAQEMLGACPGFSGNKNHFVTRFQRLNFETLKTLNFEQCVLSVLWILVIVFRRLFYFVYLIECCEVLF